MTPDHWIATIDKICLTDKRYHRDAYLFVQHALDFASRNNNAVPVARGHISGKQLLDGVREYVVQQYGPMSGTILRFWGIQKCQDIGNIVFNMVHSKLLGKTEDDKLEDFDAGFDFETALEKPFKAQNGSNHNMATPLCPTNKEKSVRPRSKKRIAAHG